MYYKFYVEEWVKFGSEIEVQGYQVRTVMYTTEYLLRHDKNIGELCIKSRDEFRKLVEYKYFTNFHKI